MIGWMILFAWIEYYAISIALLAKKTGTPHWGLYIIPFASHFFVDTFTGGFKILTIPVKKWGKTVLIFVLVAIVAQIGCNWAENMFTQEMAGYFAQIMFLPICLCGLIYWLGTIASTLKMMDILFLDFRGAALFAALMLPVPFLLLRKGGREYQKETMQ